MNKTPQINTSASAVHLQCASKSAAAHGMRRSIPRSGYHINELLIAEAHHQTRLTNTYTEQRIGSRESTSASALRQCVPALAAYPSRRAAAASAEGWCAVATPQHRHRRQRQPREHRLQPRLPYELHAQQHTYDQTEATHSHGTETTYIVRYVSRRNGKATGVIGCDDRLQRTAEMNTHSGRGE